MFQFPFSPVWCGPVLPIMQLGMACAQRVTNNTDFRPYVSEAAPIKGVNKKVTKAPTNMEGDMI